MHLLTDAIQLLQFNFIYTLKVEKYFCEKTRDLRVCVFHKLNYYDRIAKTHSDLK